MPKGILPAVGMANSVTTPFVSEPFVGAAGRHRTCPASAVGELEGTAVGVLAGIGVQKGVKVGASGAFLLFRPHDEWRQSQAQVDPFECNVRYGQR